MSNYGNIAGHILWIVFERVTVMIKNMISWLKNDPGVNNPEIQSRLLHLKTTGKICIHLSFSVYQKK